MSIEILIRNLKIIITFKSRMHDFETFLKELRSINLLSYCDANSFLFVIKLRGATW